MKTLISLYIKQFPREQDAQDLVEYSIIVAVIAFAAVAGMQSLANAVNTGFNNIGSLLSNYT